MPYTPPTSTKITTASPVLWSDNSLFTGYILFGVALPTDATGAQWAELRLYGTSQRLPLWTIIPVVEGTVDTNTSLYLTTQLDPPNTRYAIYWYDSTWKLVYPFPSGTLPSLVSVTTSPYQITVPSLTAPGTPLAAQTPAPQTSTSAMTSYVSSNLIEYILAGSADGVNTIFTIPYTPVVVASLFIDGQKQDPSTYTRVGSTVTFVTAPTAGSSVSAYVNSSIGSVAGANAASVSVSTSNGSVTGTIDGTNRYFVIPNITTIESIDWFWNGNYLTMGLDYTLAGTTVTMLGSVLPNGTDVLSARIWAA